MWDNDLACGQQPDGTGTGSEGSDAKNVLKAARSYGLTAKGYRYEPEDLRKKVSFRGYKISVRSCDDGVAANEIARSICEGIGSGGGHGKKSGEWVSLERFREKYGEMDFFAFLEQKLNELVPDVRATTA